MAAKRDIFATLVPFVPADKKGEVVTDDAIETEELPPLEDVPFPPTADLIATLEEVEKPSLSNTDDKSLDDDINRLLSANRDDTATDEEPNEDAGSTPVLVPAASYYRAKESSDDLPDLPDQSFSVSGEQLELKTQVESIETRMERMEEAVASLSSQLRANLMTSVSIGSLVDEVKILKQTLTSVTAQLNAQATRAQSDLQLSEAVLAAKAKAAAGVTPEIKTEQEFTPRTPVSAAGPASIPKPIW